MSFMIQVSIIIPVYGVEQYITKCISSVLAQTYTDGLECIIVDDCSPDGSIDIAERMVTDYHGGIRFHIIKRSQNGGLSAARNTGIKKAKGKYLYFLDSDDYILPEAMMWLMQTSQQYPAAQIVQAGIIAAEDGFRYLQMEHNHRVPDYSDDRLKVKQKMLRMHYPATVCNKLIKRQWLLDNNLFFKEGLLHEDDYWNFFAAKYTECYAVCRHDCYIYNIRQGSITQAFGERNLQSWLISINDFLANIDKVCRHSQRSLIFRTIYLAQIRANANRKYNFIQKFEALKQECNVWGRYVISLVQRLPLDWWGKRGWKIICMKILSRML